jgi:hypothetical protein
MNRKCSELVPFVHEKAARRELFEMVGNSHHPDYQIVDCPHCNHKHIIGKDDEIEE